MIATRINIDDARLRRAVRGLRPGSAPVTKMLKVWGAVYMARVRRRYNTLSRGGSDQGSWPPLSAATIRAKGGSTIILKDKGELFNATGAGSPPGQVSDVKRDRITVGFSDNRHSEGASFSAIAEYHQQGKGVPKREILIEPKGKVVDRMLKAAARAVRESAR